MTRTFRLNFWVHNSLVKNHNPPTRGGAENFMTQRHGYSPPGKEGPRGEFRVLLEPAGGARRAGPLGMGLQGGTADITGGTQLYSAE